MRKIIRIALVAFGFAIGSLFVPETASAGNGDKIIEFQDAALLKALLEEPHYIDQNGDGQISVSEASNYQDALVLNDKDISSIEGIQYFKNVDSVRLDNNNITDITPLTELPLLFWCDVSNNLLQINEIRGVDPVQVNAVDEINKRIEENGNEGNDCGANEQRIDYDPSKIAKDATVYKILYVIAKDVDLNVENEKGKMKHSEYHMSQEEINKVKINVKRTEQFLEWMVDYKVDFQFDTYVTTQTITQATYGTDSEGKYDYVLSGELIPEVRDQVINYDVTFVNGYVSDEISNSGGSTSLYNHPEIFIVFDPQEYQKVSEQTFKKWYDRGCFDRYFVSGDLHEFCHAVEFFNIALERPVAEFHSYGNGMNPKGYLFDYWRYLQGVKDPKGGIGIKPEYWNDCPRDYDFCREGDPYNPKNPNESEPENQNPDDSKEPSLNPDKNESEKKPVNLTEETNSNIKNDNTNDKEKPVPVPSKSTIRKWNKTGKIVSAKKTSTKKIKVKVKKVKGAKEYEIQFATSKKMKKAKIVKSTKITKTIKVSAKKTYYVRVRPIKKSKGICYYGKWSKAYKVKK